MVVAVVLTLVLRIIPVASFKIPAFDPAIVARLLIVKLSTPLEIVPLLRIPLAENSPSTIPMVPLF